MGHVRYSLLAAVSALAVAACAGASTGSKVSSKPIAATGSTTSAPRSCKRQAAGVTMTPMANEGATVVLAERGPATIAVVADGDERAIHLIDVDTGATLSSTKLDGIPSQLTMLDDGRVVVALRDLSKLVVFEPNADLAEPMAERCRVATPTEPVALTLSPDGASLYAVAGWGAKLVAYDTGELRPTWTLDVPREPREVIISADAKHAFIAHAVGGKATVVDLEVRAARSVATTERFNHELERTHKKVREAITKASAPLPESEVEKVGRLLAAGEANIEAEELSQRRTSCQSFALAKSTTGADRVFLPQVLVDPGDLNQLPSGYGDEGAVTELPSVAVLDPATGFVFGSSLRVNSNMAFRGAGVTEEHCILPRSAAVDEKSHSLLVGCFGTDVVVAYDALSPDPARAEKRRWRVAAGPSGIAIDTIEHRAVVWSQFDRTLNVIRLTGHEAEVPPGANDPAVRKIEVASDPERQLSVAHLLGRSLFHSTNDTRIAHDGRACASCHPDGRQDGLVWATPNGPRRTKLLAGGLVGTAPFAWDGDANKLEDHVRDTFDRLRGAGGLRSVELRALVSYMKSLPEPPSTVAKSSALVARGQAIFSSEQAGCATCHEGDTYSDNKIHDVKSKAKMDRESEFNTPSLRFLAGRAPYYHDGRYKSLGDLLVGVDGAMGHTKHLDAGDLAALEAFLLTL